MAITVNLYYTGMNGDAHKFAEEMEWQTVALDYSPITGPKGNIEFLAEIRKKDGSLKGITTDDIRSVVSEAHEKMANSHG